MRTVIIVSHRGEFIATAVQQALGAGLLVGAVSPDRVAIAEVNGLDRAMEVVGFAVDIEDATVWARIAAHIEQRLGPIDAVVLAGGDVAAGAALMTLAPDMFARGYGTVIAVGCSLPAIAPPVVVRHVAWQESVAITAAQALGLG